MDNLNKLEKNLTDSQKNQLSRFYCLSLELSDSLPEWHKLITNMKDCPSEYIKTVDKYFWELF